MNHKQIVQITWLDACSRPTEINLTEEPINEDKVGCMQKTVGYLILNSSKWVILAADFGENDQYRDLFEIPKCLVKKIKKLS